MLAHPINSWLACAFDEMAEKAQNGNPDQEWYLDQITSLKSAPNPSPALVSTVYRAISLAFPETSQRLIWATEVFIRNDSTLKSDRFEALLVAGLLMAATEAKKNGGDESITLENMKDFLTGLFRRGEFVSSTEPKTTSTVKGALSNAISVFVDWSELDYNELKSLTSSLRTVTVKRRYPLGQVHLCIFDSLFYRCMAMLSTPERLDLLLGKQQI